MSSAVKKDAKPVKKADPQQYKNERAEELNALRSDLSSLVNQFAMMQTLNYTDFMSVWQTMRMPETIVVATGQRRSTEIQAIMSAALTHATKIFTSSTEQKTKRYGAFYLLYALYMVQPSMPKVKIRFTLDTWHQYKQLMDDAVETEQWDAVYVGSRLFEVRAFHFVAVQFPLVPEWRPMQQHLAAGKVPTAFDTPGSSDVTMPSVDDLLKRLSSDSQEFELVQSEYMQAKQALGPLRLPGLDRADAGIAKEILSKIRRLADS